MKLRAYWKATPRTNHEKDAAVAATRHGRRWERVTKARKTALQPLRFPGRYAPTPISPPYTRDWQAYQAVSKARAAAFTENRMLPSSCIVGTGFGLIFPARGRCGGKGFGGGTFLVRNRIEARSAIQTINPDSPSTT